MPLKVRSDPSLLPSIVPDSRTTGAASAVANGARTRSESNAAIQFRGIALTLWVSGGAGTVLLAVHPGCLSQGHALALPTHGAISAPDADRVRPPSSRTPDDRMPPDRYKTANARNSDCMR